MRDRQFQRMVDKIEKQEFEIDSLKFQLEYEKSLRTRQYTANYEWTVPKIDLEYMTEEQKAWLREKALRELGEEFARFANKGGYVTFEQRKEQNGDVETRARLTVCFVWTGAPEDNPEVER